MSALESNQLLNMIASVDEWKQLTILSFHVVSDS